MIGLGIASLIGAGSSAATGLAGTLLQNRREKQNFQLQEETFDYQKELQQTIFDREDSSVQRRVADLEGAGLSPILAAGQGASAGQAINVTAPQRESKSAEMLSKLDMSGATLDLLQKKENISQTKAQTEKIRTETKGSAVSNEYAVSTLQDRIQSASLAVQNSRIMNEVHQKESQLKSIGIDRAAVDLLGQEIQNRLHSQQITESEARVMSVEILTEIKSHDLSKARELGWMSHWSRDRFVGLALALSEMAGRMWPDPSEPPPTPLDPKRPVPDRPDTSPTYPYPYRGGGATRSY